MENDKTTSVIPAKAGIQQEKDAAKRTRPVFCPAVREVFHSLDSRLRGNDGFAGLFGNIV
ncbi:MAG: hypothetical protein V1879_05795 [Pseudomonadota bacterium]